MHDACLHVVGVGTPLESRGATAEQRHRVTAPGVAEHEVDHDTCGDTYSTREHPGSVSQVDLPGAARFGRQTVRMGDLLLTAATIITMNEKAARAETVAVSEGRIVAVGTCRDCRSALPGAESWTPGRPRWRRVSLSRIVTH